MARVFVSWPGYSPADEDTGARLIAAGHELVLQPKIGNRTAEELATLLEDCDAAIVSTDPFTREVLAGDRNLKVIARVGVGTDSIDHDAAREFGVGISITPGMNAETVADQALAMILGLMRRVVTQDQAVKAGRWDRVGEATPTELYRKTVGLIGAGIIGKAVIRRLLGFGVRVIYFDAMVESVDGAERCGSLEELLANSDIVSLHAPLLADTRELMNAERIALMPKGSYLVNTSRGGLVHQPSLFAALRSGHLAGAALDVFEVEPPGAEALADVPNLIASAHIGGISKESIARMTRSATTSVLSVLNGEIPDTVINPEALRVRLAGA
ncbi:phosphoglycerate dehydrogenase [Sinorhizobium alkalisoli]|uniref:phosphoglycerate dehydrogenase n=1 Tax=Sinorhizobium alkalisoli TaxID=1752398 RepID=UPI00124F3C62|nr:phosphoglycerate dehydrogenase [Sinorhizobium alkalisoli]QFI68720.1 D-3-phosphoglycerate dehydrogenase [Sinorhizobium alkalisoli]